MEIKTKGILTKKMLTNVLVDNVCLHHQIDYEK